MKAIILSALLLIGCGAPDPLVIYVDHDRDPEQAETDTGAAPDTHEPPPDTYLAPDTFEPPPDTSAPDTFEPPPDTWSPPPDTWSPPPDTGPAETKPAATVELFYFPSAGKGDVFSQHPDGSAVFGNPAYSREAYGFRTPTFTDISEWSFEAHWDTSEMTCDFATLWVGLSGATGGGMSYEVYITKGETKMTTVTQKVDVPTYELKAPIKVVVRNNYAARDACNVKLRTSSRVFVTKYDPKL